MFRRIYTFGGMGENSLDERIKQKLCALLEKTVDGRLTIHGWLKRFEVGHNSADVNRLLDKLEYLKELNIQESVHDFYPFFSCSSFS